MANKSCDCWFCTGQGGGTPLFADSPAAVTEAGSTGPSATFAMSAWIGNLIAPAIEPDKKFRDLKALAANLNVGRATTQWNELMDTWLLGTGLPTQTPLMNGYSACNFS